MNQNNYFYEESGNINFLSSAISFLICGFLALVFGYVYSSLISIIPIVYANFLLTIVFGVSIAYLVKILVRLTHNRYRKSQMILALFTGIMANYFQWTTYILFLYNGGIPSINELFQNLHWLVVPENMFHNIIEINKFGSWGIFGIPFNGFVLTFIWILEALIIAGIPVLLIYKSNTFPYSEDLNKWYPKFTILKDFESISFMDSLTKSLLVEPISAIESLGKGHGLRHSKLHLYYLENEENQYLSFENIFVEQQGKGKTTKTLMINNFLISKQVAMELKEKYENKRERIEII